MRPYGGNDDAFCTFHVSCPIIHGDAERPLVRAFKFFISQARI